MTLKKKFENKYFELSLRNLLIFTVALFFILLSVYTLSIVVFFNWVVVVIDKLNIPGLVNSFFLKTVLIIIFLFTGYLTLIIFHYAFNAQKKILQILIFCIIAVSTLSSFGILLNPMLIRSIPSRQEYTVNNATFILYSYPDLEQIEKMKLNEFSAIISLLNSSVQPFEGDLLKKEIENTRVTKIKLIQINNLLPWNTSDKSKLKKLIDSLANTKGKYYVHSFMGKNRLDLFRDILLEQPQKAEAPKPVRTNFTLDNVKQFERGELIKLADGVYFTPYPNDSEFVKYILQGGVKSVVSLLDTKNPIDTGWINKESQLLKKHSISFFLRPIIIKPYNASGALETAIYVRALPKPVIVHALDTKSILSEAFIETFRHEKKAFPPSFFLEKMQRGNPALVLFNVATGPKPSYDEYKNYIAEKGITNVVYCGPLAKALRPEDKEYFKRIGLSWERVPLDSLTTKKEIKAGGLWYVYGADSTEIRKRLIK